MGKDAHMRSDVKLGFAIGGVLLAVLIVYVLVVSGDAPAPKKLATNTPAAGKAGDKVSLEPVAPPANGSQTNSSQAKSQNS